MLCSLQLQSAEIDLYPLGLGFALPFFVWHAFLYRLRRSSLNVRHMYYVSIGYVSNAKFLPQLKK